MTAAGLKLLAVAGFGAAYLWVAASAARPRVDAEYAAHFLRKTADCWLPRALRAGGDGPYTAPLAASVEIGRLDRPEACRYLRLNWHPVEGWGAWARPGHAALHLPWRPGAATVAITLRGVPAPGPAVRVRVVLNGRTVVQEVPPGTSKAIAFPLPSDPARHDPEMRLVFGDRASVPASSSRGKAREVGIGLVAIHYAPASPADTVDAHAPAADTLTASPGREDRSHEAH